MPVLTQSLSVCLITQGIEVRHESHRIRWTDLHKERSWLLKRQEIEADLERFLQEAAFYDRFFAEQGIESHIPQW